MSLYIQKAALVRAIQAVQNATGVIQIVTNGNHGLATNNFVIIDGVTSTDNVNGGWVITKVNDTSFTLNGSSYTAGATSVTNAAVYVGDRLCVNVTAYGGTPSPIVAGCIYQDPSTNAIARRAAVKKSVSATGNVVVVAADPNYSISVEGLNIYNKGGSNLVVRFSYLDYTGTEYELSTATIATLTSYNGVSGQGRNASGAVDVP